MQRIGNLGGWYVVVFNNKKNYETFFDTGVFKGKLAHTLNGDTFI